MEEGIDNSTGTFVNIATVIDDINQSNASTVDVPNSGERKPCASTKRTLCADQYGFFQLRRFLGMDCSIQITPKSLYSFGSKKYRNSKSIPECCDKRNHFHNQKIEQQG